MAPSRSAKVRPLAKSVQPAKPVPTATTHSLRVRARSSRAWVTRSASQLTPAMKATVPVKSTEQLAAPVRSSSVTPAKTALLALIVTQSPRRHKLARRERTQEPATCTALTSHTVRSRTMVAKLRQRAHRLTTTKMAPVCPALQTRSVTLSPVTSLSARSAGTSRTTAMETRGRASLARTASTVKTVSFDRTPITPTLPRPPTLKNCSASMATAAIHRQRRPVALANGPVRPSTEAPGQIVARTSAQRVTGFTEMTCRARTAQIRAIGARAGSYVTSQTSTRSARRRPRPPLASKVTM